MICCFQFEFSFFFFLNEDIWINYSPPYKSCKLLYNYISFFNIGTKGLRKRITYLSTRFIPKNLKGYKYSVGCILLGFFCQTSSTFLNIVCIESMCVLSFWEFEPTDVFESLRNYMKIRSASLKTQHLDCRHETFCNSSLWK